MLCRNHSGPAGTEKNAPGAAAGAYRIAQIDRTTTAATKLRMKRTALQRSWACAERGVRRENRWCAVELRAEIRSLRPGNPGRSFGTSMLHFSFWAECGAGRGVTRDSGGPTAPASNGLKGAGLLMVGGSARPGHSQIGLVQRHASPYIQSGGGCQPETPILWPDLHST